MNTATTRLALAAMTACALLPLDAYACSSCGCTLNSDWASQGFKADGGLSMGLRYDYFSQNDLRTGTGRADRAAISFPADDEIRNTTLTLD